MIRMRNIVLIFIGAFAIIKTSGQEIDLSVKAGAAKLLPAPLSAREGFAYVTKPPTWPYPSLYFEARKTNVFKKTDLLVGLGMQPAFSGVVTNTQNIVGGSGTEIVTVVYAFQLHVALAMSLASDQVSPSKNTFSIVGGLGFNLNGKIKDTFELMDGGYTKSNEVFQGTKYYFQNTSFYAPAIIFGTRYHIKNGKGKEVLAMDLLLNYNLIQYYDHSFGYTIDNRPTVELIPEKGFSIQLLFVKRLFWIKR